MTVRSTLVAIALFSFLFAAAEAAKPKSTPNSASNGNCQEAIRLQRFDDVEVLDFSWGWIRWLMNDKLDPDAEMTFGMVYIKPNQTNPIHLHPNSAEYLHVVEGSCEHLVGERWVTVKVGDTLRIPQNAKHGARTGNQACKAIIVYNTGRRQFVPVEGDDKK